jgi:hypothetical protein
MAILLKLCHLPLPAWPGRITDVIFFPADKRIHQVSFFGAGDPKSYCSSTIPDL